MSRGRRLAHLPAPLRRRGLTARQIADQLGSTPDNVQHALKRYAGPDTEGAA